MTMNTTTGTNAPFWTENEIEVLRRRLAAGWTPGQVYAAGELPQRSLEAIKTRARLIAGNTGKYYAPVRPMAAAAARIETLDRTIAAAMRVREPNWDLIDEYLSGLEVLRASATRMPARGHQMAQDESNGMKQGDWV